MKSIFLLSLFLLTHLLIIAQNKSIIYLGSLKNKNINAINRSIAFNNEKNVNYLTLSENKKEGVLWLPIKNFANGSITITMRGKDVFQKSFIGIAFHGLNDTTYDAVYCRPFNFNATDSMRRIHAIQYISHPFFTWKKLRETQNALFEKAIVNAPNPNNWFTLKLVIKEQKIVAFVNMNEQASLNVFKLGSSKTGKVGIFVGDDSGGDFENIKIIYKQ